MPSFCSCKQKNEKSSSTIDKHFLHASNRIPLDSVVSTRKRYESVNFDLTLKKNQAAIKFLAPEKFGGLEHKKFS